MRSAGAHILLVGTKADLRTAPDVIAKLKSESLSPIAPDQGLALCSELQMQQYLECSALDQESLQVRGRAAWVYAHSI